MKRSDIGGQDVLEGVMMRSPHRQVVAVRNANGEIVTSVSTLVPLDRKSVV